MHEFFTTDDEIVSITYIGIEDTIDINVSGNKLFFVNDILTHNSATQEQEHDHSHISGGISKIQTADNVISIFSSAAMKERGQYQAQFLKTRSSNGVGSKVTLGFDQNSLKIYHLDEGASMVNETNTASIFNDLRRKNNISSNNIPKADTEKQQITDLNGLRSLMKR